MDVDGPLQEVVLDNRLPAEASTSGENAAESSLDTPLESPLASAVHFFFGSDSPSNPEK